LFEFASSSCRPFFPEMSHCDAVRAKSPMLQQDIVATVASFVGGFELRRSFILVSKLWLTAGMDVVKGTWFGMVLFRNGIDLYL